ncbi:MAG: hypothetical protein GY898_26800 [Proteobacteria bacterium]|nr:hypothetical protein [Pseudomonadota bacterium]
MARGVASTEFVLILVLIAVVAIAITTQFGAKVDAKWRATESESTLDEVVSTVTDSGCTLDFNEDTGRWHDPETGLFVSFEAAEAGGCS